MSKNNLVYGFNISQTALLILFDLYWLRYKKMGDNWYELTDYIRDKLEQDGLKISYDDKNKDLLFGIVVIEYSVKKDILSMGV